MVRRAYVLCHRCIRGQVRLSGEPYIFASDRSCPDSGQLHLDVATIATGLLHDTLEDTLATVEELRRDFGDDVAELVDGVTKLGRITFRPAKSGRRRISARCCWPWPGISA